MRTNRADAVSAEEQERIVALYSWLSTSEMALLLADSCDDSIRELIKSKQLRALNVGTGAKPRWRIRQDWADAFLAGRMNV